MCEFGIDPECLAFSTDDGCRVVHGAGLSPEDLDKPQVREKLMAQCLDCWLIHGRLASLQSGGRGTRAMITWCGTAT